MQPTFRFYLTPDGTATYPTEHYALFPEAYAEWILVWRGLEEHGNHISSSTYLDEEGSLDETHTSLASLALAAATRAADDDVLESARISRILEITHELVLHTLPVDADEIVRNLLAPPSCRAIIYEALTEELV